MQIALLENRIKIQRTLSLDRVAAIKESYSESEIEQIIDFNRRTVEKRGEGFEVDRDLLYRIFKRLDNASTTDRRTRIIKKASIILAGITFNQPFFEGNKETALAVTIDFLRQNGYDLAMKTPLQQLEIFNLLVKTVYKFPQDETIYSEIEEFLSKRIVKK